MKYNAYLISLAPWFLMAVTGGDPVMAHIWMLMSPLAIGMSILIAYREGQWSKS